MSHTQTKATSSPDTTSTLSITILAPARLRLKTRVLRLEHPPQGRTMIPQENNNKSLTLIRTHQVDCDSDNFSKEVHIRRATSRGKVTTPALLLNFSHTPNPNPSSGAHLHLFSCVVSWCWCVVCSMRGGGPLL